jgi:hypothetical protein
VESAAAGGEKQKEKQRALVVNVAWIDLFGDVQLFLCQRQRFCSRIVRRTSYFSFHNQEHETVLAFRNDREQL